MTHSGGSVATTCHDNVNGRMDVDGVTRAEMAVIVADCLRLTNNNVSRGTKNSVRIGTYLA